MKLRGFVEYGVDVVVKFGGSLLIDGEEIARAALAALIEAADRGQRLLVIPGGGPTDKAIEAIDHKHPLGPPTHHHACALAQDQTGLILCDPAFSGGRAVACRTMPEVRRALAAAKLPILLPSYLLFAVDPVEPTWDITSDAIAAWFSKLTGCTELIVLTNVDGIFPRDAIGDPASLIMAVKAEELDQNSGTSVDMCTAPFLQHAQINCWVLNGRHPERIRDALRGKVTIGTRITF